MKEQLNSIRMQAEQELSNVGTITELENIRVKYLGKKGELTTVLRGMGSLSPEERPVVGQLANEIRVAFEAKIENVKDELIKKERIQKLEKEVIDVTMPSKRKMLGKKHPLSIVLDEIKEVFIGMGYEIAEGPEVEFDYYNFEALNIPKNHPARDVQDTFYINENILLRTQTSSVQIRVMENKTSD